MYSHGLVLPVLVLVAWSILVWLWMILGRVSVMRRERIHPQQAQRTREFATSGKEQWVADNYNHLIGCKASVIGECAPPVSNLRSESRLSMDRSCQPEHPVPTTTPPSSAATAPVAHTGRPSTREPPFVGLRHPPESC